MNVTLQDKALTLSYFTVAYNLLEGLVSVFAGAAAGSIALIGFGLDSFVESLSGGVMIWRFSHRDSLSHEAEERIEARAIKLVAYTFFVLAAYVLYESLRKLYLREAPDTSVLGIAIALVSLIVMPLLFYLKYRTGQQIDSRSLIADSKQTLGCVLLSFGLLISLGLNFLFGVWWIDPLVGLGVVAFFVKEGYAALKEQKLCSC